MLSLYLRALAMTVLDRPGISLKCIVEYFHPQLTPVDVKYLLHEELHARLGLIEILNHGRTKSSAIFRESYIAESGELCYIPNLKNLPNGWKHLFSQRETEKPCTADE